MKFTFVASVLAMAAAAIAAPAEIEALEARTGGGKTCSTNNKQVCCNGLLNCVVQVLGQNCDSSAYCCKTDAPVVKYPIECGIFVSDFV